MGCSFLIYAKHLTQSGFKTRHLNGLNHICLIGHNTVYKVNSATSSSKKTLGVIIDENLCWDKQIENVSKKVSKGIGMLRRVKPFVSIGTLIITYLYQALIQPHFDYCSMVWGNCGQTLKGMLQRL